MADKIDALIGKIDSLTTDVSRLVNVVEQNNAAIASSGKGSGASRYSSGLPGFSNLFGTTKDLDKALKVLELANKTNAQTSSLGSRIFGDVTHTARNLQAERIALQETVDDFNKSKEELSKRLNKTFASDAEMYKALKEKLKELHEEQEKNIDELEKKYEEITEKAKKKAPRKNALLTADKVSKMSDEDLIKNLRISKEDLEKIHEIREKIADKTKETNEIEKDGLKTVSDKTKLLNQQMYLRNQSFKTIGEGFRDIKRGFTDIFNIGKQFANAWMKIDTASSNFARSVGMGSAGMAALRINTIGRIAKTNLSDKYGVGMEDLVKLQAGYTSAIGRNIGLSDIDQENAIAMNVVMGERGGQLAASLENFGLSYSDAAKTAGKMFKDASKYGLSFEKYSENFLQNIKIAQNYTFKNGLKGLESMAKKATAIKLDMQQISAFAEKVGTLQGSVETAAQLQVLGGPFAQFSDPLGMLNESMTDMEGLMDRFQNMVGSLGRFDEATGQIAVSAFNKQRIRAAAQAMGMNYDQVMESVQAQGRRNYIQSKITNRGDLSDEQREFIMNTASVQNGTPTLSYINKQGNRVEKDVSRMSKEELEIARQQNQSQSDDIKNIAVDTRNMAQQITGVQNKADAIRAKQFEGIHKIVGSGITGVNNKLGIIIGILTAYGIAKAGFSIIGGAGNVFGGTRGLRGFGQSSGGFGTGLFGKGAFGRSFNAGVAGHRVGNRAANYMGRNFMKGKGLGIGLVGEIAGEIAGSAINKANEENIAKGKYKKDSNKDLNHQLMASTAQWAGRGAAIGGMFGPWGALIGAGVGALGGAIGGAIHKQNVQKKNEANRAVGKLGYHLSGDYSRKEIETILSAIKSGRGNTITEAEFSTFSKDLQDKIMASGDAGLFPELKDIAVSTDNGKFDVQTATFTIQNGTFDKKVDKVAKANGGLLSGPSHRNGGMPILGSNVEVEGGEFVVNKRATAKNISLLNSINKMGNGGIIKPRRLEDGGMITVIPTTPKETGTSGRSGTRGSNKCDINLNINGTIKLEGNGGKTVDITDAMLNDKVFIRKITKLIEKQITINDKGANVVSKALYNS